MKNTRNAWTFGPDSISTNGKTFPCTYSVARSGDVYVFTKLGDMPIRLHIAATMPEHGEAVAAANAAKAAVQPKAEAPKAAVQPKAETAAVEQPKAEAPKAAAQPKAAPKAKAPKTEQPKAETAAVEQPKAEAPKAAAQPKAAPKAKAPKTEQPKAETAVVEQPKAEGVAVPASKAWIGTVIKGKGWNIAFDAEAQRTRVLFQGEPTAAQRSAIEAAKFFWSPSMNSWNKKLTVKAYKAAVELAAALNALA